MPMTDIFAAALSRPALMALDGPLRNLIRAVLEDGGYASRVEIQELTDALGSLRSERAVLSGRLDQLDAQLTALDEQLLATRTLAAEAEARAGAAENRADRLEARLAELEDGGGAPGGSVQATRSGMAVPDYHRWMAGRLPDVVSPEGLLTVGGVAARVEERFAGRPFAMSAAGTVQIDGEDVPFTALDT